MYLIKRKNSSIKPHCLRFRRKRMDEETVALLVKAECDGNNLNSFYTRMSMNSFLIGLGSDGYEQNYMQQKNFLLPVHREWAAGKTQTWLKNLKGCMLPTQRSLGCMCPTFLLHGKNSFLLRSKAACRRFCRYAFFSQYEHTSLSGRNKLKAILFGSFVTISYRRQLMWRWNDKMRAPFILSAGCFSAGKINC